MAVVWVGRGSNVTSARENPTWNLKLETLNYPSGSQPDERLFGNTLTQGVSMSVSLRCLKAEHGDAFIITVGQGDDLHYIVVDGGPSSKFCIEEVVDELKAIPFVDLMILTHFDDDHIAGLLAYLEAYKDSTLPVREIWANCSKEIRVHTSSDISYSQANTLDEYLNTFCAKQKLIRKDNINNNLPKIDLGFCKIQVLSPTPAALQTNLNQYICTTATIASRRVENDRDIPLEELATREHKESADGDDIINRSSIAFLLEAEGKTVLIMGDADPWIVYQKQVDLGYSENAPLKADLMKVSHHGSRNNTCMQLLNILDCNKFLFSTNGGFGNSYHPDRETLAKLLISAKRKEGSQVFLYFNYPKGTIESRTGTLLTEEEMREYNCAVIDNVGTITI